MKALKTEDIKPTIVIGFDLFLNKGSSKATSPPAMMDIKYFGYLATSVSYTHLTLPTTLTV